MPTRPPCPSPAPECWPAAPSRCSEQPRCQNNKHHHYYFVQTNLWQRDGDARVGDGMREGSAERKEGLVGPAQQLLALGGAVRPGRRRQSFPRRIRRRRRGRRRRGRRRRVRGDAAQTAARKVDEHSAKKKRQHENRTKHKEHHSAHRTLGVELTETTVGRAEDYTVPRSCKKR
jgi:hypothetical protein